MDHLFEHHEKALNPNTPNAKLQQESKGLRRCELSCYRLDGLIEKIQIGTSKPSRKISRS